MKYLFLLIPFVANTQIQSVRLDSKMDVIYYTPKYVSCSKGAIYIIKITEKECVLIETFDNETYPLSVSPTLPIDTSLTPYLYIGSSSYATTRYSRSPYEIRFDCKWKLDPLECLPKRNLLLLQPIR